MEVVNMTLLAAHNLHTALVKADELPWSGKLAWAVMRTRSNLEPIMKDVEKARVKDIKAASRKDASGTAIILPTGQYDLENPGKFITDWNEHLATETVEVKLHKVARADMEGAEMSNGIRFGLLPIIIDDAVDE